jgi:transposase-like protein
MKRTCPNKNCAAPKNIIRDGLFRRKDDSKIIQRFRCKSCGKKFSAATFSECYRQKKRRINQSLLKLFSSNVSIRRSALFLGVNKKTIERRLLFLAQRCERLNHLNRVRLRGRVFNVQIDDLITKENSKLKPLSISVAVDEDRRLILGAEVSKIPAFGHLSKLSLKKYGPRPDEHHQGLKNLFTLLAPVVNEEALFKSDEHQRYPTFISRYFPKGKHLTFKSERGCVAGQGELKKVQFDPLFAINHTCATLRANVNRLIRKTWCTTKDPLRLKAHLEVFIYFYNSIVMRQLSAPLK